MAKQELCRFTKEDDEWAKFLGSSPWFDFTDNHKDWYDALSAAINQGHLRTEHIKFWCIQALYAIKNVRVELSPQHLINNIVGKSKAGHITKYDELSNFLKNHGLLLQEESFYKIKEFNFIEQKDLKEEDVLEIVKLRPVVAFIDDYDSLHKYKSGFYKGPLKRKDRCWGLHAVVVYGFGTTEQGEHYWLIQNSWSEDWGEKGSGKIIRKCSRNEGESSLLVNVIHMTVCIGRLIEF
ncbi:hypothetical protein N665_0323s0029 [Sinapis alba]|nr:hypothetical protein N665_0323s0029 [Sinapis alba]